MIREANERGYIIESMTEFWVGPSLGDRKDAHHYESSDTCKQLLPAMLCNAPDDRSPSEAGADEPVVIHIRGKKT